MTKPVRSTNGLSLFSQADSRDGVVLRVHRGDEIGGIYAALPVDAARSLARSLLVSANVVETPLPAGNVHPREIMCGKCGRAVDPSREFAEPPDGDARVMGLAMATGLFLGLSTYLPWMLIPAVLVVWRLQGVLKRYSRQVERPAGGES